MKEVEVLDCDEQESSDDDAEEDMTESDFESKQLSSSKPPHTKHIWRKKDFQRNKFVTVQDPQPQQLNSATPVSIFKLFFDGEVVQFMVDMTNLYARRDKLNHHFKIDNDEMRLFMAMLLLTGYTCLPRRRLYWENRDDASMANAMSRNCFENILSHLHLSDNLNLAQNDKMAKVRPFYNLIVQCCFKYRPNPVDLSVDELMLTYFGRNGSKQRIQNKRLKRH